MATKKKTAAKKKTARTRTPPSRRTERSSSGSAELPVDPKLERIRAIVELFDASSLAEFEYEDEEMELELRRYPSSAAGGVPVAAPVPAPPLPAAPVQAAAAPSTPGTGTPGAAASESASAIKSPFVGTFYKAPSPEAPPFCEVGQRVSKGQTLCIIEAMKLMNEIPSEFDGVVTEILAENGQPVQFGDELFRIKTQ